MATNTSQSAIFLARYKPWGFYMRHAPAHRFTAAAANPLVTNVVARFHAVRRGRVVASVSVCEHDDGVFDIVHTDPAGRITGSGGAAGPSQAVAVARGLRAAHQYGLNGATHVLRDGDSIKRPVRVRMARVVAPAALQDVLRGLRAYGSHPDEGVVLRIAAYNKSFRVLAAVTRAKARHLGGR